METDKITALLNKYYSGDILPLEYQSLLSALKDDIELPPELETEQKMFLAIEAYAPLVPEGLENRLIKAIDRRNKRAKHILKMFLTGSAAAVIMICITVASYRYDNKAMPNSELAANVSVVEESSNSGIITESIENENTGIVQTSSEDFSDEAQIVNDALLEVLSNIHMAQNDVIESIESIQVTPSTNLNI